MLFRNSLSVCFMYFLLSHLRQLWLLSCSFPLSYVIVYIFVCDILFVCVCVHVCTNIEPEVNICLHLLSVPYFQERFSHWTMIFTNSAWLASQWVQRDSDLCLFSIRLTGVHWHLMGILENRAWTFMTAFYQLSCLPSSWDNFFFNCLKVP